jgi:hypothetical protein
MDRTSAPGTVDGLFSAGNPFESIASTVVDAVWLNGVQEELVAIIEAAGIVPSAATKNQVLAAIQVLFGNGPGVLQASAAAPLVAAIPVADDSRAIVLASQSGLWTAGVTTEAPTQGTGSGGDGPGAADNTDDGNEYDLSLYPGDLWPWVTPCSQMAHDTAGSFPAAVLGSNVNWYRHGFFLPRGLFVNGAAIEVVLTGGFFSSENRTIEVAVEPELDIAAAFDVSKSFIFQTATLATTAAAVLLAEFTIRIECLGFDDATSEWVTSATCDYKISDSSTASLTSGGRRGILKRIAVAKADFDLADTLWNVRFKTDDAAATLGDVGNSSGSAQDGASGVFEVRNFRATLFPGAH